MKIKLIVFCHLLSALCLSVHAQGTAFTYQGRLNDGANAAHGSYDLTFSLFNVNSGGSAVAGPLSTNAVAVTNGLFTVSLDFGAGVFNGTGYWLEVGVRTNGGGAFIPLSPRQQLTPAPYAIYAENVTAAGISGTIPTANFGGTYGNAVTFNNGADNFDGSFFGQFFGSTFTGGIFTGAFVGTGSGLGDVWHTGGNSGTTAGVNFVGTTDNQPLELHVNGVRGWRLEPTATLGTVNVVGGSSGNFVAPGQIGSTIAGGGSLNYFGAPINSIAASMCTIGGGDGNSIQTNAYESTIAGGNQNVIQTGTPRSTIGGGFFNQLGTNAEGGFVGGGEGNTIQNNSGFATVGGGYGNAASYIATIGGGAYNATYGNIATIGGGWGNYLGTNAYASFIGGGFSNRMSDGGVFYSAIGGGYFNSIGTSYSFVGSGSGNTVQPFARYSVLTGGETNTILTGADHSVIGGGSGNMIGAPYATVPGGYANYAGGLFSFAAGSYAQATNEGSFVWSDGSSTNVFASGSSNQFLVRATGGIYLFNGPFGVNVDQFNANNGDLNYALRFGFGSGEGIASKRTAGGNQYGLDFYTQFSPRMSISSAGVVSVPGLINSGSQTGTAQAPNEPGLVVRRINSTITTAGSIIARSDVLTLERDGSNGGLRISYPASPGIQTIAAMGMNNAGGQVNFYTTLSNPGVAGTVQIYSDAQNVHFTQISFGNTFNASHLTQVSIARASGDNFWIGTVNSTFNQ